MANSLTLIYLAYGYLGYITYKFMRRYSKRQLGFKTEKPDPKEIKLLLKWIVCTFLLLFESWIDAVLFWVPGAYMYKTCAYAVILFDNSMAGKFFAKFEFLILAFERAMDFVMLYAYKFGARFGFPFVLWFLKNSRPIIFGSNKEQLQYVEHHLNRYSDLIQLQMSETQQQPQTRQDANKTRTAPGTVKRPPTAVRIRPGVTTPRNTDIRPAVTPRNGGLAVVTPRNVKPSVSSVTTRSQTNRAQTPKK